MFRKLTWFLFCLATSASLFAQSDKGDVRGFVYNADNGDRLAGALVWIPEINRAPSVRGRSILADGDGFYALTGIPAGEYTLVATAPGFDTAYFEILVRPAANTKQDIYLHGGQQIEEVEIIARANRKQTLVGATNIDPKAIGRLPSVGGEPDIVQYLQVLPGVVFSGDQGGQLYIRGGSPVMNKVLFDGMTIYNPFHSIGLFSVFDTDLIKSADVYSAGFGAEYGGRISAVVDIKSRDGDRNQIKGKTSINTFTSKVMLEGPLKKFQRYSGNSSFAVSYRNSYLKQSSKLFYGYANPDRLPYNFGDLFVKINANSANGGYTRLYGFHFSDDVNFPGSTHYSWASNGFGGKFMVVPEQAKTRVDGFFLYSNYRIQQMESDARPRESSIGGFNMGMNFLYNFKKDEFKWGMEMNGFQTNFQLYNANNRRIEQQESTTEINLFGNYKVVRKKLLADMGLRWQYYASLSNGSLEPRLQLRYMPFKGFGLKFAAGLYSQNLLSAISDRDVVNLFYGFLSGPDNLPKTFMGQPVTHRLQKAGHLVAGMDYRLTKKSTLNVEGFYKDFSQITNINRSKLFEDDASNQDKDARLRQDFIIEKGEAYGGDISYKFEDKRLYIWLVYSLTWVNRNDGYIVYQPIFDRRHNANAMVSYTLGKRTPVDLSVRWNFGSGFPFTQTQGYYEKYDFGNGIGSDYVHSNGDLGVVYASLNQGRLPYYHRLDFSAKHSWKLDDGRKLTANFSLTNAYNRDNIFYYDRIKQERVDQLPILPALGIQYEF
ncbi:MAG: TonB-dependent receptor [Bacteroidetes bacterium]|nr:TonB-dependent receptor [Bacteroidota bacterium]